MPYISSIALGVSAAYGLVLECSSIAVPSRRYTSSAMTPLSSSRRRSRLRICLRNMAANVFARKDATNRTHTPLLAIHSLVAFTTATLHTLHARPSLGSLRGYPASHGQLYRRNSSTYHELKNLLASKADPAVRASATCHSLSRFRYRLPRQLTLAI